MSKPVVRLLPAGKLRSFLRRHWLLPCPLSGSSIIHLQAGSLLDEASVSESEIFDTATSFLACAGLVGAMASPRRKRGVDDRSDAEAGIDFFASSHKRTRRAVPGRKCAKNRLKHFERTERVKGLGKIDHRCTMFENFVLTPRQSKIVHKRDETVVYMTTRKKT